MLAGDTLRSAADLSLPMVGVTLASRAGYFQQKIDGMGRQIELPEMWDPALHARQAAAKVAVQIERRRVWVGAWVYRIEGLTGGCIPAQLIELSGQLQQWGEMEAAVRLAKLADWSPEPIEA